MAPTLNIIIGSTRPGRLGPSIANWFDGFVREHGAFEPVLVDLADFELPVYDEPNHPRFGNMRTSTPGGGAPAWKRATPMCS